MNRQFLINFLLLVCLAVLNQGQALALEVSPSSLQLKTGQTSSISISKLSGQLSAQSDNAAIASVSYQQGRAKVEAKQVGSTQLVLEDKKSTKRVSVTVTAASNLTVTPASVSVAAGKTATVAVTNFNGQVEANSANTAIATVSYANGVATVLGRKVGSTTLTIKDKSLSKQVAVTVTSSTPPATLSLSPSSLTLAVGSSQ